MGHQEVANNHTFTYWNSHLFSRI